MPETDAAVRARAELVDLGEAAPEQISAVQARYPGVGVCAASAPADLTADVAVARETGVMAICSGIEAARASGLPPGRVLVEVPPGLVAQARRAGWAALVDADRSAALAAAAPEAAARGRAVGSETSGRPGDDADPELSPALHADVDPAVLAIAAIASWLGAAAVRTRYPGQVRRALDMTASIRGLRPPARAVRGLA
jgi:dihydropteroate synthase